MTIDELNQKHIMGEFDNRPRYAVSIEYAISVLEELADGYQIMTDDGVNGIPTGSVIGKIKDLKSLLK